jgi:hypothetical protein
MISDDGKSKSDTVRSRRVIDNIRVGTKTLQQNQYIQNMIGQKMCQEIRMISQKIDQEYEDKIPYSIKTRSHISLPLWNHQKEINGRRMD